MLWRDKLKKQDMVAFRKYRNKYKVIHRRNHKPEHSRCKRPYSQYEDEIILEHKIPDAEIAKQFGTTPEAIQCRRWKLKKNYYDTDK